MLIVSEKCAMRNGAASPRSQGSEFPRGHSLSCLTFEPSVLQASVCAVAVTADSQCRLHTVSYVSSPGPL